MSDMEGKDINELLATGMEKIKDVPLGGGGGGGGGDTPIPGLGSTVGNKLPS